MQLFLPELVCVLRAAMERLPSTCQIYAVSLSAVGHPVWGLILIEICGFAGLAELLVIALALIKEALINITVTASAVAGEARKGVLAIIVTLELSVPIGQTHV